MLALVVILILAWLLPGSIFLWLGVFFVALMIFLVVTANDAEAEESGRKPTIREVDGKEQDIKVYIEERIESMYAAGKTDVDVAHAFDFFRYDMWLYYHPFLCWDSTWWRFTTPSGLINKRMPFRSGCAENTHRHIPTIRLIRQIHRKSRQNTLGSCLITAEAGAPALAGSLHVRIENPPHRRNLLRGPWSLVTPYWAMLLAIVTMTGSPIDAKQHFFGHGSTLLFIVTK